ncbi:hypothetical protein HYDPIDRAFT_38965, partial [Hydnomerulius pinastri MD-312]
MEEPQIQNAKQRELLTALSDSPGADSSRQHEETINAVRATTNEQVPYNEFSKALATEVRMLLGEVDKVREERRTIQHELGYLVIVKSKYGPGGEFDHGRKPSMPPGTPPAPPPPPEPPAQPGEIPPVRPTWRTVPQRGTRRIRRPKQEAPPPEPVPEPRQVHDWVTWQPNPAFAPTPPSVEPPLLVPDGGSPGLFGPRSPRDSYRGSPEPRQVHSWVMWQRPGADSSRQHKETINVVCATANEQYLYEFSKALATEVRMLLSEVDKVCEERRTIQHELGYLMMMKSKYGPGGEFDPEWFVVLSSSGALFTGSKITGSHHLLTAVR